jgi:hypothetical protein
MHKRRWRFTRGCFPEQHQNRRFTVPLFGAKIAPLKSDHHYAIAG